MGDVFTTVITTLTPVVIELVKQILVRTTKKQNDIREDLDALQIDLGIIKDIVKVITKNNLTNFDGLIAWKEAASTLVKDAETLLRRIEEENNRPQKRKKNQFHCSSDDTTQLKKLKRTCENLAKHHETVLRLNEQYRRPSCWLFCGWCG